MMSRKLFYLFAFVFVLNACRKDKDDNPTNPAPNPNPPGTAQGVQFDTIRQYLNDTSWFRVTVQTKDPVSQDVSVKITYTTKGIAYTKDFTTTPASDNGIILLTIPAGKRSAYFDVQMDPLYLADSDDILFKLDSAGTSMPLGVIREYPLISLGFAEKYIDLDRGDKGKNRVFINFEKLTATAIDRNSWDLSFYSGQDDYRVLLNSATGMLAYRLDKNDLANVSAADTVGLVKIQTTYLNIDNPNGDLTKTAIAAISATPEDNKVYIINRRPGVGNPATGAWKKVRILRNASGGYTLQQADIASTTYYSINITKDEAYYFNYISFENGAVIGEPKKEDWDLVWTSSTVSRKSPEEMPVPHFQDHVLQQNRNTKVAVGPSDISYQKFSSSDVPGLAFNTHKTISALNWRPSWYNSGEYQIIQTSRNKFYKFRFQSWDVNSSQFFTSVTFRPLR